MAAFLHKVPGTPLVVASNETVVCKNGKKTFSLDLVHIRAPRKSPSEYTDRYCELKLYCRF